MNEQKEFSYDYTKFLILEAIGDGHELPLKVGKMTDSTVNFELNLLFEMKYVNLKDNKYFQTKLGKEWVTWMDERVIRLAEKKIEKPEEKVEVKEEEQEDTPTVFLEDSGKLIQEVYDYEANKSSFIIFNNGEYKFSDKFTASDGKTYIPFDVSRLVLPSTKRPIINFASKPMDYQSFEHLFNRIYEFIKKYFDIPETDVKFSVYFIIFTWIYDKLNVTPYMRFIADYGCGKTRGLWTIGSVCYNSFMAAGCSTLSGAMRLQNKFRGVPLFNETDFRDSDETNNFIKWVNNGLEKGIPIIMSNKENPDRQDIFDPYGPKLFVMKRPFDDTATESRLISITPKETSRKDIPILLPEEFFTEALELRNMLLDFRLKNWFKVNPTAKIDTEGLQLEARLKQITYPLAAVIPAEPQALNEFKNYLKQRQIEIKRIRSESFEGIVFNAMLGIMDNEIILDEKYDKYKDETGNFRVITSSMLSEELHNSQKNITQTLKSIGFQSESKRIDFNKSTKTVRHLVVTNQEIWDRVCRRYYVGESGENEVQIPDCLKSKEWLSVSVTGVTSETTVTDFLKEPVVTDVTDVTAVTDTGKNKNGEEINKDI